MFENFNIRHICAYGWHGIQLSWYGYNNRH